MISGISLNIRGSSNGRTVAFEAINPGEEWDGTHSARPSLDILRSMSENIKKVYCSCKERYS
jgi:hypothetical protein